MNKPELTIFKPAVIIGLLLVLVGILAARVWSDLQFSVSRIDLPIASEGAARGLPLRVAVLGDLHVGHGVMDLDALQRLFDTVIAEDPDLIVLVGDYAPGVIGYGFDQLRRAVVERVKEVSVLTQTYVVLGNYENWSGAEAWFEAFREAGVNVLENEAVVTNIGAAQVCVRGLGDYYSGRFRWVNWPDSCTSSIKITLTHDPAGAFVRPMKGVTFAGHTHCGQVRFPFVGALWMPTTAPREATCGLYRDPDRTLYVTSGVGTSILPLRFGAPSTWDMVTLVAMPDSRENS